MSENGTQYELVEAQKQSVRPRDIELPDVEVRDRERVRNSPTGFEDMWRGQLGEVKGRAQKIDPAP